MKGILYFDIDGTLVDSERGEKMPCASAMKAIEAAKRNGYLCVISSGRSLCGLRPFFNFGMDGYIFSDGAGFAMDGRDMILEPIDYDVLKRLIPQVLQEHHGEMLMCAVNACYASEGQYSIMQKYIDHINDAVKLSGGDDFAVMERIEEYRFNDPILEIDVSFDNPADEEEWLKHLDPSLEYISTTASYGRGGGTAGEITAAGMTKGNRALMVADLLGIDHKDTYAFGDSMNDSSMIRACGHGICMGNGAEELKQMAEYVADRIENDGLAKAMVHYGIIEECDYE